MDKTRAAVAAFRRVLFRALVGGVLRRFSGVAMVLRMKSEDLMSSTKKQAVTITRDPPDLERVKRVAERERGTPSGVIRRLVVEGLHALQNYQCGDGIEGRIGIAEEDNIRHLVISPIRPASFAKASRLIQISISIRNFTHPADLVCQGSRLRFRDRPPSCVRDHEAFGLGGRTARSHRLGHDHYTPGERKAGQHVGPEPMSEHSPLVRPCGAWASISSAWR
jgi:hypothetical protein